ncbi:tpr domain containing protein [Stylonychia lemnae]|uniref:Tpr domain containing protein n=1 Tax=Stylonychia lemnae TaxID=5949 RepID=A0A078B4I0_STYLE|nr:tpr domain containing protein [Stylonychia lemnae]|eukprot:CDW88388.1 tpr domain containing protein [Stylonychia lemnae]
MDLSFKLQPDLEQKYRLKLNEINQKIHQSYFGEAETQLKELQGQAQKDSDHVVEFLIQHKLIKILYITGEYLQGIKLAEEIIEKIEHLTVRSLKQEEKVTEGKVDKEGENELEKSVKIEDKQDTHRSDEMTYLHIKAKWMLAKIQSKIRDIVKADEHCKYISSIIRSQKDPKNYWKFELKALYLQAKHQECTMEFEQAKRFLVQDAQLLLDKLFPEQAIREDQALPQEQQEAQLEGVENKVIHEEENKDEQKEAKFINIYLIQNRREYAYYLKKFAFYDKAVQQLKDLMADEISYFKLETDQQDGKDLPKFQLQEVNRLSSQQIAGLRSISKTIYYLGKVFGFQHLLKSSLKCFETYRTIGKFLAGHDEIMETFKSLKAQKDVHLKVFSVRNKIVLDHAQDKLNQANQVLVKILGMPIEEESKNYLIARQLKYQGEIMIDKKNIEEAEKLLLASQRMIGAIYSDNHPIIIEFNNNLIELYSAKDEESQKAKAVQISLKNLEIAKQYYGPTSIYMLKQELQIVSNLTNQQQFSQAQQHVAQMRLIVQRCHNDDAQSIRNQFLFLAQILAAVSLMSSPQTLQSAEKILQYVYDAQLVYVEEFDEHPFLEQTLVNIGIFYRSMQKYDAALYYWERVRLIQEKMYLHDREVIIYTLKNIGICQYQRNLYQKAEESYQAALQIIQEIQANPLNDVTEDSKKEDNEQLSQIYYCLYQSAVNRGDKVKGIEYNDQACQVNKELYGVKSINVSNNHFVAAQLYMKTGKIPESREHILQAIESIESVQELNSDEVQHININPKSSQDLILIKMKYRLHLANLDYISSDLDSCLQDIDDALKLTAENTVIPYEHLEEIFKIRVELKAIQKRAKAKKLRTSSLDGSDDKDLQESQTAAQSGVKTSQLLGVFSIIGTTSFLASYLYMKAKN